MALGAWSSGARNLRYRQAHPILQRTVTEHAMVHRGLQQILANNIYLLENPATEHGGRERYTKSVSSG